LGENMNSIKRKTIGVFVCMLMLATIPLVVGAIETEPDLQMESK